MNNRTLKITYGAMLVAIFGMLLLLNRQTGGFLQEVIIFILPVPIAAYAVKYGGKASITVFVCMVLISFLFGTFSAVFYAISAAFVGLVLGTRLYHKRDMTRTLLLTMLLCMICELISTVVIGALTGQGLDTYITELQEMMNQVMEQSGVQMSETMLSEDYLRRMFLVAIAFTGALEGFIIYNLTILILRRLKIRVPKPTPVAQFTPPKWFGYVCLALFFVYVWSAARPISNEAVQSLAQVGGMIGYLILLFFGVVALAEVLRAYVTKSKAVIVLLVLLSFFILPYLDLMLGFFYLSGSLHERLLEKRKEG